MRYIKRNSFIPSFFVILILILTGCLGQETNEGSENNVIRIGFIGPLTGKAAQLGWHMVQGGQLAVDEVNAAGGIMIGNTKYTVQLITADSEYRVDTGVAVIERLIVEDNVDVVVGGLHSSACLAAMEISQELKTPFVITGAISSKIGDRIAAQNMTHLFQLSPTAEDRARIDVEAILTLIDPVPTKIALIAENSDAGRDISEEFMEFYIENMDFAEITIDYVDPMQTDFTAEIAKISGLGIELLWLMLIGTPFYSFADQWYEGGDPKVIVFADGGDATSNAFLRVERTKVLWWLVDQVWITTVNASSRTYPFVQAYSAKYGDLPLYYSAQQYDGIYIVLEAMKQAGNPHDKDAVASALEKVKVTGVKGQNYFRPIEKGHTMSNYLIVTQIQLYKDKLRHVVVFPLRDAEAHFIFP
ncbi:MAG: ABC transporter substrate-binding protein [Candidatus Heimdallarchaeota archaeon]